MGYSSDLRIASPGTVTGTIASVASAFPTSFGILSGMVGTTSYPWIDLGVNNEKRYRGVALEFLGGATADASFASPVIYAVTGTPVGTYANVYKIGTAVLTTGATALDAAGLNSAYGLSTSFPCFPATTFVSYTTATFGSMLDSVSGIAGFQTNAGSDMACGVLSLPYLDGVRYLIVDPGLSAASKRLTVLYRLISRDA